MTILHRSFIFAIILLAVPLASSQASDPAVTTAITQEIRTLRSLDATQRPLTTIELAHEVALCRLASSRLAWPLCLPAW